MERHRNDADIGESFATIATASRTQEVGQITATIADIMLMLK
jgi:hypothetical protein